MSTEIHTAPVSGVSLQGELDRATVEQKVLETVRALLEALGKDRALAAVGLRASLERDLGLGSLERMELISNLETELSVELSEAVLSEADTPSDLVEALLSGTVPGFKATSIGKIGAAGTMPPPESAETLVEVLQRRAESEPRRPHIHLQEDSGGEQIVRYGDLYRDALALAGGLAHRGIEPGDTVAVMLPTGRDFFTAFMGALLAGGVPVPLYPPFRMDRLEEYARRQAGILRNAEVRFFITVQRGRSMGRWLSSRVPALTHVVTVDELVSRAAPAPAVDIGPDASAFIQYTSGSTGEPKGVVLTHRNLLANIRAIGRALDVRGTDVAVSWLPLYHDMGLIGLWLAPLYLGVPVAILSPIAFLSRPERWLWSIHAKRATISAAPNFAYELCFRRIRDEALEGLDLSCWRAALNGAEPVSPETIDRFTRRFSSYGFQPEALMPVYGLAETSLALTIPPLARRPRVEQVCRESFEKEGRVRRPSKGDRAPLRFVSSGIPLPEHQVRILGPEGMELPERMEGRLHFRGASTMQGYYGNPEATREVLDGERWLDSGDRAFVADGEVFVTGRSKDMIIRAGRNICPQEAEEVVADVEGVRRGCVVAFGMADARQGTERLVIVAEVRAENEEERQSIRRSIQERIGCVFGSPADEVLLVPPRTVPKTSSGKLRRSACRDLYVNGELTKSKGGRLALLAEMTFLEALLSARRLAARCGHAVYGGYVVVLAAATIVPFWLLALVVPSRRLLARAVRLGSRFYILMSGCRLRVRGLEYLQEGERAPYILVSNHASYFDPLPLLAALPLDYAFVVKREAASWPIFGTFIRRLGHLSVERDDPRASASSTEPLSEMLRKGRSVFFFPEGTFTHATGLRPFKLGAFKLAAELGRPVVPLALRGTRRWLRDRTWLPRRSDLEIVVEAPVYAGSRSLSEIVRLRDETARTIAQHVGEPRLDLVAAGVVRAE